MTQQLDEKRDKEVWEGWFKEAREIKTPEALAEFAQRILNLDHDYGTCVRAVAAVAVAGAWLGAKVQGITGFQAGCVMWDFVRYWHDSGEHKPRRLVDYSNMLYPQYDHDFERTITADTWKWLQEQAATNLKEREEVGSTDWAHWKSIVAGTVPFGYAVKEED